MHSSRYTILAGLINNSTHLPQPLGAITLSYLVEGQLPDFIASFFLEKNPAYAKTIAKICFENLKKLPEETKKNDSAEIQYARADGVANALCELTDDKTQFLFQQWELIAQGNESESKDAKVTCSRYRLLIAYYLPTPTLLTDNYGMQAVQNYLDAINETENRLVHALKIKLAIARQSDTAIVHALLDKSTIHLNLLAANITNSYSFHERNLDYTCLKNAKFAENFINAEFLPPSCAHANLDGVEISQNIIIEPQIDGDLNSNFYRAYVKIIAQAQGGLDIAYGPDKNTLLHFNASSDFTYCKLIQYGANATKKNAHNELPCHRAFTLKAEPDGTTQNILPFSNNYKWLLQSLPDEDLLILKKKAKHVTNDRLTKNAGLVLLLIVMVTVFSLLGILATTLVSLIMSIFTIAAGATLVIDLTSHINTHKAIDRQLAINAHNENKIHALFFKIVTLGNKSLTVAEQVAFNHLTTPELEKEKITNNEFRKNELFSALAWLLATILFVVVAAASITILMPLIQPLCQTATFGLAQWAGELASVFNTVIKYAGIFGSLASFWYTCTSLYDGLYLKRKMDGLINTELALKTSVNPEPASSPTATPVSELKAINTVAPVIKAAPASPGKVSSLSLLRDQGVSQMSPSSGLRSPSPLTAFRH